MVILDCGGRVDLPFDTNRGKTLKREKFLDLKWKQFCDEYCSKPSPERNSFYMTIAKFFFNAGIVWMAGEYQFDENSQS